MLKGKQLELSVGAFVLLGLIAVIYFAVKSGSGEILPASTYAVVARFTNVGGLRSGAPVLVAGVSIGQVGSVDLDAQFAARVELRLRRDVRLPADTMASIRSTGLIGAKIVALLPGADERMLAEGGLIVDTESAVEIETLISRFAFGEAKVPEEAK